MQIQGVDVSWLGHATIRLKLDDGTTVLVDPWLEGNPSCPESEWNQEGIDAIYVTHGHFDHVLGVEAAAKANDAALFAIHEVAEYFTAQGLENVTGSNKGGRIAGPNGIYGTLVDAVHSSGISGDGGIVAGGEAGGWIIDIPSGPTFYFAGDTTIFGDMALIGEIYEPDVAFLPIGGHYTMGAGIAAKAAKRIGVEKVVPIHFGTFPILSGTPDELRDAGNGAFEVIELELP